jgi:hypothetical protein
MVAMGRRSVCCGAGSGASARFSGGCWPASPKVALAGVAASGREYAIRVRGRATTVVPEAATSGPSRPTWAQPATARRRRRPHVELCSDLATSATWRVASGGPPLTPRASVPQRRDHPGWEDEGDAHRTGRPGQEHRHPDHPGPKRGLPRGPPAGGGGRGQAPIRGRRGRAQAGRQGGAADLGRRLRRPGRAGRGRQAELGAGPCMVAWHSEAQ